MWQSADPTDAATAGTRDRADHDGLLPGTTPGSDVVAQWTGHDRVRTETRDVLIRGRDAVGDLIGRPAPPLAGAVRMQPGGGHDRDRRPSDSSSEVFSTSSLNQKAVAYCSPRSAR
ncbi:hypothetical protein ACFV2U_20905 [Streptomyces sp. NPDC059697]|uniref:hypothetical protein n=1 Tax=Streptomyces sp. NPDC059697 TaxID=3346912 RepID=UPI00367CDE60